jgi:hypothetical protein
MPLFGNLVTDAQIARPGKRLPRGRIRSRREPLLRHLPGRCGLRGNGNPGAEEFMKRLGIAILLLSSFCWAENPDGFEPASTNVWGAAYPRVDPDGKAEFRGGFSGAAGPMVLGNEKLDPKTSFQGALADPNAFAKRVHLLWLGVGTAEPARMKEGIEGLNTSLDEAKIKHVFYESPGTSHEWQTWRRDLKDFAPRLFQ